MEEKRVIIFIAESSIYTKTSLEEFTILVNVLKELYTVHDQIIDVEKEPKKADEYKVTALPTLIIGEQYFVGQLNAQKILSISTIASGQGSPYFSSRSRSSEPPFTPMRIEQL